MVPDEARDDLRLGAVGEEGGSVREQQGLVGRGVKADCVFLWLWGEGGCADRSVGIGSGSERLLGERIISSCELLQRRDGISRGKIGDSVNFPVPLPPSDS